MGPKKFRLAWEYESKTREGYKSLGEATRDAQTLSKQIGGRVVKVQQWIHEQWVDRKIVGSNR